MPKPINRTRTPEAGTRLDFTHSLFDDPDCQVVIIEGSGAAHWAAFGFLGHVLLQPPANRQQISLPQSTDSSERGPTAVAVSIEIMHSACSHGAYHR
jgi:hypothetical protein